MGNVAMTLRFPAKPFLGLTLGQFEESGEEYIFDGNESLMTIARPGAGKTQAHVLRNLVYLQGPAIVLDVKPEIEEAVSAWRLHFGPAAVFAPGRGESGSIRFNPLDAIPNDPVQAYPAIGRLVPLLMVPTDAKSAKSFWEGRAAQLLTAALYDVCLFPDAQPSKRRDMTAVVDWFSATPAQIKATFQRLQASGIRSLVRAGNQIEAADPETQANLFETVLRHIDIWGAPQLEEVVSSPSLRLETLRRERVNLYLCVTPEELVLYRPLIRAMLGQLLYALRDQREEWNLPTVTFFLDEFPQLGYFPEVEQMLALGRQMGLRLWLFAQTRGQLEQVYGSADRLLEMLAIVAYMQPTASVAEEISRRLGPGRDLLTGLERPLVSPQELMGPAFADKVIVFEAGRAPAKLRRIMAFQDEYAVKAMRTYTDDEGIVWDGHDDDWKPPNS
ncbi:MAG: type IV secretory system conjugative DNA transfer family protein [Methylobacterium sp.]|nr:type IV secretory system conjugative DNA transfer family protein [Hyphomonadaceae bacterium]